MNIEILGPRGSGKSTLAHSLEKELSIPYVSLGDLTRKEMRDKTAIGQEMERHIAKGNGYPPYFLIPVIEKAFAENDGNVIFDGFPRQVHEAKEFTQILKNLSFNLDIIARIDTPLATIKERVNSRLICNKCGMQGSHPQDFCCPFFLSKRQDDSDIALEIAYKHYIDTIEPITQILVADTYAQVVYLNGEQPPLFLTQAVLNNLQRIPT